MRSHHAAWQYTRLATQQQADSDFKNDARGNQAARLDDGIDGYVLEELEYDTLERFVRNDWFTMEDMASIGARIVNDTYRTDPPFAKSHFEVVGSYPQLGKTLQRIEAKLQEGPMFIVYNKDCNHWITVCIVDLTIETIDSNEMFLTRNNVIVLVKDSMGDTMPHPGFERVLRSISHHTETLYSSSCEQTDDFSCGPLCLRNLQILCKALKGSKQDVQSFVDRFKANACVFANNQDIDNDKQSLLMKLKLDVTRSPEFLNELQSCIGSIRTNLPTCQLINDYQKILVAEYKHAKGEEASLNTESKYLFTLYF